MNLNHVCKLVGAALLGSSLCLTALAGEVKRDSDRDVVWEAGVDGVEIEWAPDGGFKRIYSSFYQPVNFPDRRGISKAQIIAEEKAKAAIVRFMNQQVSSARFVQQIDKDLETATRTQDGKGESWTKQNQRTMVETLTEVTGSYASGRLRGVIALEKGYDESKSEAWVKVGISSKTMAAAQGLADSISAADSDTNGSSKSAGSSMRQGSEIRRSSQKDW